MMILQRSRKSLKLRHRFDSCTWRNQNGTTGKEIFGIDKSAFLPVPSRMENLNEEIYPHVCSASLFSSPSRFRFTPRVAASTLPKIPPPFSLSWLRRSVFRLGPRPHQSPPPLHQIAHRSLPPRTYLRQKQRTPAKRRRFLLFVQESSESRVSNYLIIPKKLLRLLQPLHHPRQRVLIHRRHRIPPHLLHPSATALSSTLNQSPAVASNTSPSPICLAGSFNSLHHWGPSAARSVPPYAAAGTSSAPSPRSPSASPRSPTRYASHPARSPAPPTPARSIETVHSVPCTKSYHTASHRRCMFLSFLSPPICRSASIPCKLFQ